MESLHSRDIARIIEIAIKRTYYGLSWIATIVDGLRMGMRARLKGHEGEHLETTSGRNHLRSRHHNKYAAPPVAEHGG